MHSPAPMQNGAAYGMPLNSYSVGGNNPVTGPINPGYHDGVYNQPQLQNHYNMMPNSVQTVNQQMIHPQQIQTQNQMMNMYNNQSMPMPQQQIIPSQNPHLMSPGSQQSYQQPGISQISMMQSNQIPNQGTTQMMNNQIIQNHTHPRVMSPQVNQVPQPIITAHHGIMNQNNNMMGSRMIPPQNTTMPGQMAPHNEMNNQQNMMMNPQQSNVMMTSSQNIINKTYPNQPIIFNSQNPNVPPIYPCGVCHTEVQGDNDQAIMCESGCNYWFHRVCVNMMPEAYDLLKKEVYAEWCCDNCYQTKRISPLKFKS